MIIVIQYFNDLKFQMALNCSHSLYFFKKCQLEYAVKPNSPVSNHILEYTSNMLHKHQQLQGKQKCGGRSPLISEFRMEENWKHW